MRTTPEQEHASPYTVMERAVELIEEMKTHPHQEEIFRLAAQQLEDMYSTKHSK